MVRGSSSESLLVFSDVHLGNDLNDRAGGAPRRSEAIDGDLCRLIAHYRREPPAGERWRMVIAGDFIDFIGMAVALSDQPLATEATEEEREHGLGNTAEQARLKLGRVATRHADVFAELAQFVAEGHALTLVRGNHDIDFHWDAVQQDFRALLLAHAPAVDALAFLERIEFQPWFFYRQGVVYIEHGHQYDPFCATEHVMVPVSPLDPRRIARSVTDVLLRFVVRPTKGMKEHGHDHLGLLDYVAFGARLGVSGLFRLASGFARAVLEMFRVRRGYLTEAASLLRSEHERRVAHLAEVSRLGVDRLRALLALQVQPLARSVGGILASVLLDRLVLALGAVLALSVVAVVGAFHTRASYAALAVVGAWVLVHRHLTLKRQIDPAAQLAQRAHQLATLFPAAFVVMGHTHSPVQAPAGDATYINLGAWAEEDESEQGPRATRTHLVIHPSAVPEARLLAWESGKGPRAYVPSDRA